MEKIKKIMVVTGTRAEYGLLKPVMKAIKNNPQLELLLAVTGAHFEDLFGSTVNEIIEDGFSISANVKTTIGNTYADMSNSLGQGVVGFTEAILKLKPDIVLVLGDRVETFSAALSAYYLTIPIAHIHGGDKSTGGCLDDSARHAISKLAQIHFAATERSAERLRMMGEEPWRVHTVGAPGIDSIKSMDIPEKELLWKKVGFDPEKKTVMVLQHPVTNESSEAARQMVLTLAAASRFDAQKLVIYPNQDAGSHDIIDVFNKFRNDPQFTFVSNLNHNEYLGMLRHADVLVGNSSGGIIETPALGLPVVNVGPRQEGRERADNVIDAPYDSDAIERGIAMAISLDFKHKARQCSNPYGDGKSGERISSILSSLKLDEKIMVKKITY